MYVVRFSYDVLPTDRNKAANLIQKEVTAAKEQGLNARFLIPLTRGREDPALECEIELSDLGMLDEYRKKAIDSDEEETHSWMRQFSEFLVGAPMITIFRVGGADEGKR